ncbi:hypothetical protein HMPREF0476_1898 [Kingella kingae ATCC 23330]|uniref:Uncharacterized protein n=1 Tax=Kingella kingae ATCC 23330 TaxID=887327 RepID=F5S9L5_KINKI|nr:hypothetical protein HMPREF0476_1898 [Kingella kingae ATCC 23330]
MKYKSYLDFYCLLLKITKSNQRILVAFLFSGSLKNHQIIVL